MKNLTFHLEPNSDGKYIYQPNQILRGFVKLFLDDSKKLRACCVIIHGQARAHWKETKTTTEGSEKSIKTVTYAIRYEGKEMYLNSKTYLFGSHDSEARKFEPGIHRFDFECQLPDLPSSISLKNGEIEYYAEVVLDIPWNFDKECKLPFTIVRHDDLNLYPELKTFQRREETKKFCCLFCQLDPLRFSVSIPYSGFALGHIIPVLIEYTNQSNVDVESTKVKLQRVINFISHTPEVKKKTEIDTIYEKTLRGVAINENAELQCILDVPKNLMNSNDLFCRVIKIQYYIEVEAVVNGCNSNPIIVIPITIGSIPLNLENDHELPSYYPSITHQTSANDLPPSFEEAMIMANQQSSSQSSFNDSLEFL